MCNKSKYYDGTKLLSMTDINGEKPEIYICTGNRTAGKTVYFNRLCVNKFIKNNEKFMIIYRFNYEVDNVAEKFFKDIGGLFFPDDNMESSRKEKGLYHELYLNGVSCGYAISLNSADQIKKNAHLFSDTCRMIFDEFQSETNNYCKDEIQKLFSIHTSVARGQGKQVRYVPVYMISNNVSLINPYFVTMGISNRLNNDTKFLRGEGFVLEQCYNESAANAQKQSGFNKAFSSSNYAAYSTQGIYLVDNIAFIEKPKGRNHYLCTLKCNGACYGVREFIDLGIVYCDDKPDMSHPMKISVTTDDHNTNYVMIRQFNSIISGMRFYFEKGCFRFKNLKCKETILTAISY